MLTYLLVFQATISLLLSRRVGGVDLRLLFPIHTELNGGLLGWKSYVLKMTISDHHDIVES